MVKEIKETIVEEKKFTKNSLVNSEKYKSKKILLKVLLEDEKKYSFKEVEKIIDDYLKKGVK
ncbi:hypothetical protein [Fusobacterium varium]